ncbi:MAG: hypothetical protein KC731_25800 [Myxococcales bacterium]|nr:hypothetical protein [Myxococcales bacterium]
MSAVLGASVLVGRPSGFVLGRSTLGACALATLLLAGCSGVCPTGSEEGADPGGMACEADADCFLRCACTSPDGEREVVAGSCINAVCVDAEHSCSDACSPSDVAGFCALPD